MVEFKRVYLQGELGEKKFVLRNGQETKTFYDAGNFNYSIGQFPIYNENNEIVEYMDLMGTFSKENTNLAVYLYNYVLAESYMPLGSMVYQCGIYNFPSKYLTNEKVKRFIVQEEKARYKKMKTYNISLIEKLNYRIHTTRCLQNKLKNAKHLIKEQQKQEKELKNEI